MLGYVTSALRARMVFHAAMPGKMRCGWLLWDLQRLKWPVTTGLPQKPDELALFYRPDLFHNWHLGMGQCFVASSLVLLSDMCAGSSIPKRFEELTHLWRSWCRDQCLPYLSSLLVKQQQNAFVKLILLRSLVFFFEVH